MRSLFRKVVGHPLVAERPGLRQFVKFGIVGAGNTLVDFGTYFALTRGLHFFYLVAQVLSFLAAVAVSYLLNKRWTFRDQRRPLLSRQLIQFLLVSTVGVVLSTVTLALLVRYGQLSDLVAKVIVVLIVLFWNFFANKHWTFRGQS